MYQKQLKALKQRKFSFFHYNDYQLLKCTEVEFETVLKLTTLSLQVQIALWASVKIGCKFVLRFSL